tara:strand:+ start:7162 stop:7494 length:333 start_codon:yes stop_codon:yes gene_type:complete
MKQRYGKLVRDNIPNIIRANGETPNVRIMNTDEYRRELLYKLIEEAEEVRQAGYDPDGIEFVTELADLAEVLDAVFVEFEIKQDLLEKLREDRKSERGGFAERIFLESVQ